MTRLSTGLLGAALLAWAAGAALAQTPPGAPATPPGPPSSEGTNNPYPAPRMGDAGDSSMYLSNAAQTAKAVRDARPAGDVGPAAPADILAGSKVRDKRGKPVGVVEAVEGDGAIVATPLGRVKVPLDAFGKDPKGLMLGISKAEFDAVVAAAVAAPAG